MQTPHKYAVFPGTNKTRGHMPRSREPYMHVRHALEVPTNRVLEREMKVASALSQLADPIIRSFMQPPLPIRLTEDILAVKPFIGEDGMPISGWQQESAENILEAVYEIGYGNLSS